jgi:hypothetical protein
MQQNAKQKIIIKAITLVACMLAFDSFAQGKLTDNNSSAIDVAVSAGSKTFSGALSWSRVHLVTKKLPRLKIGYGVRFTTFIAANKFYATAPAKFTSPVQNLGTIFSRTIAGNIDTITTATATTNSVNAAIYIQYSIISKLEAGFNIDAVGFSTGSKKEFNVISSTFDPNQSPVQQGSPTRLNLLLTSDNDIGSLNSEFYVRYWANKTIGIKAGYTFLFSEYELDRKLSFDGGRISNDRYRYKASMIMLGLTYKTSK